MNQERLIAVWRQFAHPARAQEESVAVTFRGHGGANNGSLGRFQKLSPCLKTGCTAAGLSGPSLVVAMVWLRLFVKGELRSLAQPAHPHVC